MHILTTTLAKRLIHAVLVFLAFSLSACNSLSLAQQTSFPSGPVELKLSDGRLVAVEGSSGRTFDVYIWPMHKVGGHVDFMENWPEGELTVLKTGRSFLGEVTVHDDELKRKVGAVKRGANGPLQTTYNGLQLYLYSGEVAKEMPGFWELARAEKLAYSSNIEFTLHPLINPPQPARGP